MTPRLAAAVLIACPLSGCSSKQEAPPPRDTTLSDYVKTGVEAREQARTVAVSAIAQNMLQQFRITQGREPASVAELEQVMGALPGLPPGQHYAIDPAPEGLRVVAD